MDAELAHAIADGYERWTVLGDRAVMDMFSSDFYDNVSGRSGLEIFEVVESCLDASFTDRRVEHHATMSEGDRVVVWFTAYGRHIGNAFPRMADCQSSGADIALPQVRVFRVDGELVVEHWAMTEVADRRAPGVTSRKSTLCAGEVAFRRCVRRSAPKTHTLQVPSAW